MNRLETLAKGRGISNSHGTISDNAKFPTLKIQLEVLAKEQAKFLSILRYPGRQHLRI